MGQIPCSTERISCVKYHQYADDRQIYIAIFKDDSAVQLWVSFCWFAVAAVSTTCSVSTTVNLSSLAIQPAAILKSLSVVLDHSLWFDQQVSNVCRACYCHIPALRHISDSLLDDVARTVTCTIASSRLDYCNALYAGMSSNNSKRLQHVQNMLSRVTLKLHKSNNITPALIQLH